MIEVYIRDGIINILAAVRQLSGDAGIPSRLEVLKEEALDFLAESAFADACCPGNPKDMNVEYLKERICSAG